MDVKTVTDNVEQMRPKRLDSEKVTVNLGFVDLGHVDLLVQEGLYSNRTDFVRTAIRNRIERARMNRSSQRSAGTMRAINRVRRSVETVRRATHRGSVGRDRAGIIWTEVQMIIGPAISDRPGIKAIGADSGQALEHITRYPFAFEAGQALRGLGMWWIDSSAVTFTAGFVDPGAALPAERSHPPSWEQAALFAGAHHAAGDALSRFAVGLRAIVVDPFMHDNRRTVAFEDIGRIAFTQAQPCRGKLDDVRTLRRKMQIGEIARMRTARGHNPVLAPGRIEVTARRGEIRFA